MHPQSDPFREGSPMNVPQVVESLIPLAGGALVLRAALKLPEADPRTPRRRGRLRWLGAAVALTGFIGVVSGLFADPPAPDARALAAGMRQKLKLPLMVDDVTRLDAIDGAGRRLVMHSTITKPLATEAAREAVLAEMARRLKPEVCRDEKRRKLLRAGLGLEFEYTMDGRAYPSIVLVEADCD